jgi:hypothetical protein
MRVMPAADSDSTLAGGRLFVVIGAQRTGTNILREILNTNEQIAMLGEVLSPSPAPAHWDNFSRNLPIRGVPSASYREAAALLDQYFDFVEYRIRNHWEGGSKRHVHAFGVDIKYDQLARLGPADWNSGPRFILFYLRSRGATLIHATRNVIHSAISAIIASERNLWHNYDGDVIDRSYNIDAEECLAYARMIVQRRNAFLASARDCNIVNCRYESLIEDLERSGSREEIPHGPGPLGSIAAALGSSFNFRYDRRLQKAINVPYSRLLSNYSALVARLKDSEFSDLSSTLE